MALVLTLCALVLITVLLVAFFSKAQLTRQIAFSSTNVTKSESVTRAATNFIIGELRQEIADSSTALRGDSTQPNADFPVVYQLKPGFSPQPTKVGIDQPDVVGATTLAKVSADGKGVRPSSAVLASGISIDQASVNGRRITWDKWFGAGGPVLGSQATLPTWVYMTRSGAQAVSGGTSGNPASADYVVGRYAYTIYDVSGRLDANVAGYPVPSDSAQLVKMVEVAGGKFSTAYADLSALDSTLFTKDKINSFVQWRNGVSANSTDDYKEFVSEVSEADGNLHATNAENMGFTQKRFFSRKDMLRSVADGILPGRPELFTHFSRAKAGPSWAPDKDAAELGGSTSYAYRTNADQTKDSNDKFVVNRNVANVRRDATGTITRYRDDGTSYSVNVEAGDQLVPERFSLAKLAWLGHDGPNAAAFASSLSASDRAKAIKDCFGLTWDADHHAWEYDHGSSGSIYIMTLGEISGRDPDFFELLKAGILEGSLGGHPGASALDIASTNKATWEGPVGQDFEVYSLDKDRHLAQIGANIIDQADANNFPIAIYLKLYEKPFYSESENRFYNTVFGLENLPMLSRFGLINHMMADMTNATAAPGPMGIWFQPELWNPHNSATVGSSLNDSKYPTPTALRIATYGRCYVWNVKEDPAQAALGPVIDFGNDFGNPKVDGIICFKNPSTTSTNPRPFFNNPVSLTGLEKASAATNYYDATCPSGPKNRYPENTTWANGAPFLAIFLGEVMRDPRNAPLGSPQYTLRAIPDPYITLVAEYYDGTRWLPYSTISRLQTLHTNGGSSGSRFGMASWRSSDGHIDPRTDRFSASAGRIAAGQNAAWKQNHTVRSTLRLTVGAPDNPGPGRNPIYQAWPRTSAGFTHAPVDSDSGDAYLFDDWAMNLDAPSGTKSNSNPISAFRYKDADGITRPGDSWRADFTAAGTGDGVYTYHQDLAGVTASATRRRPVILNRPFRSVGELGYVYRDLPFKSLDLWSEKGADAALLDLFSVSGTPGPAVAGRINLNAAPPEVMKSILRGAAKQPLDNPLKIEDSEAGDIAGAVANALKTGVPIDDRSDLVGRLSNPIFEASSDVKNQNKGFGETTVRALANCSDTRTWNLLIDVVAQTGRVLNNDLQKFVVEGECRLWVSVAIDRMTGEIVDQQLESVDE